MSLFDNLPVNARSKAEQAGFNFPASLVSKYRPRTFDAFIGLEKVKRIVSRFAQSPKPDAFLFVGPSGVGKTSMGLALCEEIKGELHHVPSQKCNVATLEEVIRQCHFYPANGKSLHVILIDEGDQMTKASQLHLLSKTDQTAWPPNTLFILTCNSVDNLEDRLLSRFKQIPFPSHGLAELTAQFLETVWTREVGEAAEKPNFLRIVRDSQNNVRSSLNALETEILAA